MKAVNIIKAFLQWLFCFLTKDKRDALGYALHETTVLPQMLSQKWQISSILPQAKHEQENENLI